MKSKRFKNLPENTNIINGLAYITKSNIKKFVINSNKYIHNILDKEHNQNNSEKESNTNQYSTNQYNTNQYKHQYQCYTKSNSNISNNTSAITSGSFVVEIIVSI